MKKPQADGSNLHPIAVENLSSRALGWVVFGTGMGAWLWTSWRALPYILHLRYLFILKWGSWELFELPHPLFVPLLGAYQFLLESAGYTGNMLIPLELLNLAAGGLTLVVLFVLAQQIGQNSLMAAAGVICLAYSPGFHEGALRPAPYSLAAAFTVLTLAFLLDLKEEYPRRDYILAGAAAGLTVAFHSAGIVLIPVAAAVLWRRSQTPHAALRPLSRFISAMAIVIALSYGALALYHGFTLADIGSNSPSVLFQGIEQVPRTSFYTTLDPFKQIADFLDSFKSQTGPFGFAAALYVCLLYLLQRMGLIRSAVHRQGALVALASVCSFAFFFAFNNTQNGLIYAMVLPVPLLLAALIRGQRPWMARLAPLLLVLLVLGFGRNRRGIGPTIRGWVPSEISFLSPLMRAGDFMVTPICPAPEMLYQKRFNILQLGDMVCRSNGYIVPQKDWESMSARISAALKDERRVFYWPGTPSAARQFSGQGARPQDSDAASLLLPSYRQRMESAFLLDCRHDSPNGWAYCQLALKSKGSSHKETPAAGLDAVTYDGIAEVLRLCPTSPDQRQIRYLMEWLAQSPDDAYVKRDLLSFIAGRYKEDLSLALSQPGKFVEIRKALAQMFPPAEAKGRPFP